MLSYPVLRKRDDSRVARSSSRNAVNFSPARTPKRFPLSRCASAIQIVRPQRSMAETQPQLQPASLRLSAIISHTSSRPRATLSESKQIPSPEKSKGQRRLFAFRSSSFFFHPRRIVSRSADGRIAHGKNLTYLNRYNVGPMYLAVILAAGHAFFACFSCHLGSPLSLRSSRS